MRPIQLEFEILSIFKTVMLLFHLTNGYCSDSKKTKPSNNIIYLFMYELAKSSEDVSGRLYHKSKYLTNVPWL